MAIDEGGRAGALQQAAHPGKAARAHAQGIQAFQEEDAVHRVIGLLEVQEHHRTGARLQEGDGAVVGGEGGVLVLEEGGDDPVQEAGGCTVGGGKGGEDGGEDGGKGRGVVLVELGGEAVCAWGPARQ